MPFFYYERNALGRWGAVLSDTHPGKATSEGKVIKTAGLVELTGDQAYLTFGQCMDRWPVGWWEPKPSRAETASRLPPREGETINAGFFVFRRGDSTNRIRPSQLPFEHPSLEAAVAEAQRLAAGRPGYAFDVFTRHASFAVEVEF